MSLSPDSPTEMLRTSFSIRRSRIGLEDLSLPDSAYRTSQREGTHILYHSIKDHTIMNGYPSQYTELWLLRRCRQSQMCVRLASPWPELEASAISEPTVTSQSQEALIWEQEVPHVLQSLPLTHTLLRAVESQADSLKQSLLRLTNQDGKQTGKDGEFETLLSVFGYRVDINS